MKFVQGQDRSQMTIFPVSLDAAIDKENIVRIIDYFVDSLNLSELGFNTNYGENGRPAYHPKDLLKLFIYGYLNRIRSSRQLEKECKRNIELMWLMRRLVPDHNTISNFRRDNPKAIKKVFRATVNIAKNLDLIGGILIAGDGTKLRAQNSKKNNYNQKKIDRHLAYIENKLAEYCKALETADGDKKKEIKDKIDNHKEQKKKYQDIEKQLKETGEKQISTSDPESRHMITRNNITEVAYNIQTTVDEKNKIPIDYKVTNTNDGKAMGNMLRRAKSILGTNHFTALYDKGYHTGSEFEIADKLGINVLVAIPKVAINAPDTAYNVENFTYDKENDLYICPQGNELRTTGRLHKGATYNFKRYTTKACKTCPVKEQCSKAKYGKAIQRSEYQELIENNKVKIKENETYYKQRQAIVEHPYGTIKRQWGFNYIMTKKYKKRAEADVGLIFTAYNLRRIMNILGTETLRTYLKDFISLCLRYLDDIRPKISRFKQFYLSHIFYQVKLKQSLKIDYI